MNAKAMEWALAQTSLSILQKSILINLASEANDDMLVIWRSQGAIATSVGCSRPAANRALNDLALLGRIRKVRISRPGGQMPCAYVLNCVEEEMSVEIAAHDLLDWHRRKRSAA
jgi:predicted transcriptional regulator